MRRVITAAGLGTAAVMLAAGCGTVRSPGPEAGHSTGTAAAKSAKAAAPGPATITRADATRLAQSLLARTVVPRGSHLLTGRAPAAVSQSPDLTGGRPSFTLHRIWTVNQSVSSVYGLVSKHVLAGLTLTGSGQSNTAGGVSEEFASFGPRRMPAGVNQAVLSLTVAPSGAVTLLRADVQVIWYPPRSAAEHIPAGMHAVTVTGSYLDPGAAQPRTVTRTFTSAAVAGRLAALLNGAEASVGGDTNCPLERATYTLAFAASRTATPGLVATEGNCDTISITVSGHPQPALEAPGALGPALDELLLGKPTDLPSSARIPPGQ